MTADNNDKLLEDFFAAHRRDIADNGFTRRVMHRLPERRYRRLAQAGDALVLVLAGLLFVFAGGLPKVWGLLCDVFTNLMEQGFAADTDPGAWFIAGAVLLVVYVCRKIGSLA